MKGLIKEELLKRYDYVTYNDNKLSFRTVLKNNTTNQYLQHGRGVIIDCMPYKTNIDYFCINNQYDGEFIEVNHIK